MKNLCLIFLFFISLDISSSVEPKKDKYELPKVQKGRNFTRNIYPPPRKTNITYKYFAFSLKDLYKPKNSKNDLLYFEMNSSLLSKNISYTLVSEPKEKINLDRIGNDKIYRTWHHPNVTIKQTISERTNYKFSVYVNSRDKTKRTIIIRAGPTSKYENVTCMPLNKSSKLWQGQYTHITNNQNQHLRHKDIDIKHINHKIEEIKRKFDKKKKPFINWNHSIHDWENNFNKFNKHNKSKNYEKKYKYKHRNCSGMLFLGLGLTSIWGFLILIYCLVNRRKQPYVGVIKNPQEISLSNYQNI